MTQGFLLDGQWISEGEPLEVRSPFDGSVVGSTFRPRPEHLETAVQVAIRAFDTTRKLPAYARAAILRKVAESIEKDCQEFARTIALEAGKPIRTARLGFFDE